jgi:hypothetical protein
MKSKGFLDDIEKVVDDFSTECKKQINTNINRVDLENHPIWDRLERQRHRDSLNRFSSEYLQQYTGGQYPPTIPKSKEVVKCRCGVEIEIFFTQGEIVRSDSYDWTRRTREVVREKDNFRCPRCAEGFRIVGKITDLKVKMME